MGVFYELDQHPAPGDVQVHAIPIWKVGLGGQPLLLGERRFDLKLDETNAVIESDERTNALSSVVWIAPSKQRSHRDELDTVGAVVHPVFAVPTGALDEQWDVNSTIESIGADMQTWLREQTGGRGVVWDEANGCLDIMFVQMEQSEADLVEFSNLWEPVAEELYRQRLNDPNNDLRGVVSICAPSRRRSRLRRPGQIQLGAFFILFLQEDRGWQEYLHQPTGDDGP